MSNSLGKLFRVTSFGESHGKGIGVVIDGCPAGLPIDPDEINTELDRRKPQVSVGGTPRSEADRVEIIAGVYDEFTTGAPLCLMVANASADSSDYEKLRFTPRPSHADYTAFVKYGGFNDFRGGGRFSGRLTAGFVMAGAVAKKLIAGLGIQIVGHTAEIGGIASKQMTAEAILRRACRNPLTCADTGASKKMQAAIKQATREGDSLGGIIEGIALNVPPGLGEPVFDSLDGALANAIMSIPAVKGVEFGSGFKAARMKGSENNDPFLIKNNIVQFASNNAGGILGGISSGAPIVLRVAIKPVPSIHQSQDTVDLKQMKQVKLSVKGRNDVCIVPRAVVVVEAMIAIVLCDFAMISGLIPKIIE